MKQLINQNVNYANHTNSSAPKWSSSSAAMDTLSTIIRNRRIVIIDTLNTAIMPRKEKEQLTNR